MATWLIFSATARASAPSPEGPLFGVAAATCSTSLDYVANGVTASTPEPSTWALTALGFARLGFSGYRRARKAEAAIA
jgi:hypothetical protein